MVSAGCLSFGGRRTVASARANREHGASVSAQLAFGQSTSLRVGRVASCARPERAQRSASIQASIREFAGSALVSFALQVPGKAASPTARPNHSFKRTRLRRSA